MNDDAKKPSPDRRAFSLWRNPSRRRHGPARFRAEATPQKGDRKVRQLCSQVAETLSLVLSGECADELLQNLEVVAVDPAPNASLLLVTVRSTCTAETVDSAEVSARLAAIMGKLLRGRVGDYP